MKFFVACFLSSYYLFVQISAVNKYSKDVNINFGKTNFDFEYDINVRTLDKPFRMAKLNLLWTKAQVRLTEPKLKSLLSELKIHDKEELAFKKVKSEGGDKEGLKEADMRKRLIGIMSTYGLLEHFEEVNDPSKYKPHKPLSGPSDTHLNKSLFKDKKLNKLWEKAERSGFTAEELQALKEEFSHHQDKIDQYYSLLNEVEKKDSDVHVNSIDEKLDRFNMIDDKVEQGNEESNYIEKANELRDKHRDLRDGYDRLHRLSVKGPKSNEFVEPKVQGLWKLATETNFTADELESLKVELAHYEKRLLKLRHLQVEAALAADSRKKMAGDKLTLSDVNDETIKKQARKVEKLHLDLEARIMQKHIEL
ncbi:alpha-2-macroglobulin receptor-associated protein [Macrosteles quadrilineatus]|uniref:alpha-2-macroglobulin receptor-associated protein n=1 Tax=Macrosteles quadrilineatus TaxID=74068 RepID=UPI0023E1ABA4|nr:alpha-2-macroglobulin receptor-associated protein [Macrosteles quadrilineatus]